MANAPTRRKLLGTSAAAALGGVLAGFGTSQAVAGQAPAAAPAPQGPQYLPFHGKYQSGILDAPQAHAVFVGWNLNWREGGKKDQLRSLLKMITDDAQRLTAGRGVLADTEAEMAAGPSDLTVTVGVGQNLLEVMGGAKVGTLPGFAGDKLQQRYGQSDLLIQFCGQDPTVLAHAVRAVSKNLRGLAQKLFTQRGFMHQRGSSDTFRNLFGQLDGVNNPKAEARELAVFGTPDEPSWIANGTTLALRRFEMDLEGWDEVATAGRDFSLGRRQSDGSPLTGSGPADPVDLHAVNEVGLPVIGANSHVALAMPRSAQEVIHRRGYNFVDGEVSGLLFVSYQRDPAASFIPLQQRLAEADLLNTWLTPTGSALYAILPGIEPGMYLGQQLLG